MSGIYEWRLMAQGWLSKMWQRIKYAANACWEAIQRAVHSLSRTLFTRYLLVTSTIVIISFILFGVVLANVVTNHWQAEKQQLLVDNVCVIAERAAKYIVPMTGDNGATGDYEFSTAASTSLRSSMAVIGQSVGAELFLLDINNTVVVCSEDDAQTAVAAATGGDALALCKHRDNLPADFFSSVITGADKENIYRATGDIGSIYGEPQFIAGAPIIVKNAAGLDVVVGVVVAVSSARSIEQFQSDITNVVVFSIIIASLVLLGAVYLITYRQVKPLREMAAVVSKFTNGDFAARVQVTDETEVGQLASAFNNMATSLESGESMRRSFVANVSHELKTPMTTISGFVDGILDGTIPADKHNHYLSVVSSETKRLARLVRSMLDLSRIDSGDMKLNITRFDISKTVTNTLLSFEQLIENKNVDIQGLDSMRPVYVRGDSDLLHQVVYNLMENAVKFTNNGGYIKIKVYSKERDAYVRIANSGIGIPSDELPRVFERFYKTDKSRSHDKSGVGLGLYIVKTVIALHGGEIAARSTEGSYCEFEFHIPISGKD